MAKLMGAFSNAYQDRDRQTQTCKRAHTCTHARAHTRTHTHKHVCLVS